MGFARAGHRDEAGAERDDPALVADREQGGGGDRLRIGRRRRDGGPQRVAERQTEQQQAERRQQQTQLQAASIHVSPSSRTRPRRSRSTRWASTDRPAAGNRRGSMSGVHRGDHRRDPALAALEMAEYLALAHPAMLDQPADMAVRLLHRRAVGRIIDRVVAGEQPVEAGHIVRHVAVRRSDHGRRPAHDMVASEQGALLRRRRGTDGWTCGRESPPPRASSRLRRAARRRPVSGPAGRRSSNDSSARGPESSRLSGAQPTIGAPVRAWSGRLAGLWSRWVWVHRIAATRSPASAATRAST